MPRFAANLGYLYTDRPLLQRIDAVADGFDLRSSTLSPALRVESMTIAGT